MAHRFIELAKLTEISNTLSTVGHIDRAELIKRIMALPTITGTKVERLKHKPRSVVYNVVGLKQNFNRWKHDMRFSKGKQSFLRDELTACGVNLDCIKPGQQMFCPSHYKLGNEVIEKFRDDSHMMDEFDVAFTKGQCAIALGITPNTIKRYFGLIEIHVFNEVYVQFDNHKWKRVHIKPFLLISDIITQLEKLNESQQ